MSEGRRIKVGLHLPEIEREIGWREIADVCRIAEDVGFDSIWMPDHLLYRDESGASSTTPWESWSMLSAIAAITNRVELGPLVLCASFRNPALVAKMAATLDEISGGRLILGLGAGWNLPEYEAFGFRDVYDTRFGRFSESFTIIRTLLREGELDFEGRYYTIRGGELRPRGPRPDGPRLLIGSTGPRMLEATLPHVDAWNAWFAWGQHTADDYRPIHATVDDAVRAAGRSPADVERTLAISVAAPLDSRRVEAAVASILSYEEAGVDHLQVLLDDCRPETVENCGEMLSRVRASRPARVSS